MKVVHVLGDLNHSGAEEMLRSSFRDWRTSGVDALILGMSNGSHPFAPKLVTAGYDIALLPDARSARGAHALLRVLRSVRPTVVHVHTERCFDLISLLAATTPGVDAIIRTVHNNFLLTGLPRGRRLVRRRFVHRLGVTWVACSTEVAATEDTYSPDPPTQVIENWVDVGAIETGATPEAGARIRGELNIDSAAPVLTLVGNCGTAKNHEFAATTLDRIDVPVHLLHVGSPAHQQASERRAWGLVEGQHVVHHLGTRRDIPAILAATDLLLLPSYYEGMPLAAIEALCARVPVLAADNPGLTWLRSMPSATLTPLDERIWAEEIRAQLGRVRETTHVEHSAMAARARFMPARGVNEYVALYEAVLGSGGGRSSGQAGEEWSEGGSRRREASRST